jgi:WD40 repeat protein
MSDEYVNYFQMPIAMNFDLLSNNNHQVRCEHLTECETNLDIKLSKSILSNGTNRQTSTSFVPIKPHLRSTLSRITRQIDLEQLSRCSLTRQFTLPNVENEKWLAVASSNEYVLVGGGSSSTLRLFDFQGKEIRMIDIKTFAAFDLAWSNVLNGFLIAGYDRLQIYNVETDQLTSVENLNLINRKDNYFWSITCHK